MTTQEFAIARSWLKRGFFIQNLPLDERNPLKFSESQDFTEVNFSMHASSDLVSKVVQDESTISCSVSRFSQDLSLVVDPN